jgi:hypothetical protein
MSSSAVPSKAMTPPPIWRLGLSFGTIILAAFARLRRRKPARAQREFDGGSLAGVPRRILLSERSNCGGLLRETVMIRPSSRD